MFIKRHEGAGRVRLSNGRRMSLHAFQEAMNDRTGVSQQNSNDDHIDDLYERVESIESELKKRRARAGFPSALDRAAHDREIGRLPAKPEVSLTHHTAEDDLWN